MKIVRALSIALVSSLILTSCTLTVPVAATSNPVGSKRGQATGTCYLYSLCFGADASIETAAKNGGITKISTVDITTKNILGIVVMHTTTVTGE